MEIEYDLHGLGLDLLDFFRGRHSWRKLAAMIVQLPSSSRTAEAMANDDEMAEKIAGQKYRDTGPRLSEYTPVVARLDVLADRIAELIALTVQVNNKNGKAPRVRPARRPETAITRAERRRAQRKYNALVDEVTAAQQRFEQRQATAG